MTTRATPTKQHFTPAKSSAPAGSPAPRNPAPAQTAEIAATASAGTDKERAAELNAKVTAYQAKPAPDNQTRLDIAHIVSVSNDEVRAISGTANGTIGGLQGPRVAGSGAGR
jgi:hypothetical protein